MATIEQAIYVRVPDDSGWGDGLRGLNRAGSVLHQNAIAYAIYRIANHPHLDRRALALACEVVLRLGGGHDAVDEVIATFCPRCAEHLAEDRTAKAQNGVGSFRPLLCSTGGTQVGALAGLAKR